MLITCSCFKTFDLQTEEYAHFCMYCGKEFSQLELTLAGSQELVRKTEKKARYNYILTRMIVLMLIVGFSSFFAVHNSNVDLVVAVVGFCLFLLTIGALIITVYADKKYPDKSTNT